MNGMTRRGFLKAGSVAAVSVAVADKAQTGEAVPASARLVLKDNWLIQSSALMLEATSCDRRRRKFGACPRFFSLLPEQLLRDNVMEVSNEQLHT